MALAKRLDVNDPLRWALSRVDEMVGKPKRQTGAPGLDRRGISVGRGDRVPMVELLAALEPDPDVRRPRIAITVDKADLPGDRARFEAALAIFVEDAGLGEWIGGVDGHEGGRPLFEVRFAIDDLATALPLLQGKLRELGAGPTTTLQASDGSCHTL